ncbi:MAG: 50S ribosomal protein L11 methyltransferase [Thermodesulfobacteriota bacterium]
MSFGEYVPGEADSFLIVELLARGEEAVRRCRHWCAAQGLNVEDGCQGAAGETVVLAQASPGADLNILFADLALFLDDCPDIRLIESRLASPGQQSNHVGSFLFTDKGEPGSRTILLDPGHAFGSGQHPSTRLMIEAMEGYAPLNGSVLDVGSGSGILSIVAAHLGASSVVGVDICSESCQLARKNSELNRVEDRLTFTTEPLRQLTTGPFNFILANLTSSVLQLVAPDLRPLAAQGCLLMVAGMQGRRGGETEKLLAGLGWRTVGRAEEGGWQQRSFVVAAS